MSAALADTTKPTLPTGATAEALAFRDLAGWQADDHAAAFATFLISCRRTPSLREATPAPALLGKTCENALRLVERGTVGTADARHFFEQHFQPFQIKPAMGRGFTTGYFEPEFEGARQRSDAYPVPVYRRPPDLVTKMPGDQWPGLDLALSSARKTAKGLEAYPDRSAIDAGLLAGQGLEVLWMRDEVDRFVMQVQGSGRIRLPSGETVRLVYAGRNGLPYTSLGRVLSQRENIPPAEMTMDRLVARLKADKSFARALIAENRSFVFFDIAPMLSQSAGPIGGAGVSLTPHRSIAADRAIWAYGLPAWLSGELPLSAGGAEPLQRLAIIQDTGSAIVGPARIDVFLGSGPEAGHRAGLVRHPLDFTILWPKAATP
ncbi:MAG: murein transglycosylase A [Bosea sp. (in: a-proteobacteria)]